MSNLDFYKTLTFAGKHTEQAIVNIHLRESIISLSDTIKLGDVHITRFGSIQNRGLKGNVLTLLLTTPEEVSVSHAVPICKVADNGLESELAIERTIGKDFSYLDIEIADWVDANAHKYKIRQGKSFHIKKAFALLKGLLEFLVEKYSSVNPPLVSLNQTTLKTYINSCSSEPVYIYHTGCLGGKTFAEMERLIYECYATQLNSNANSCMTKYERDWKLCGADYTRAEYDLCFVGEVFVHPFQAYNTSDWSFAFASKHAPEKVLTWSDETKSPFIARAILNDWANGNYENPAWRVEPRNVCYGAREITQQAFIELFGTSGSRCGSEVRLYRTDTDEVVLPYIDGNDQIVGDKEHYENIEYKDEIIQYTVGVVGAEDYETVYENTNGYATGSLRKRLEYCEVRQEMIDADDAVWIPAINAYVHYDFACGDELDGVALFRYFR